MTNTPNIPVPALANEADNTPTNEIAPMKLSPELLKLLGLAETADEAAVIQAVTKIVADLAALKDAKTGADQAKKDAEVAKTDLETTKTGLENAVKAARSARIELALDRLVTEGRVLPAERTAESTRLLALANDAAIGTELETLGKADPKLKTKSQTTEAAARRAEALQPKTDRPVPRPSPTRCRWSGTSWSGPTQATPTTTRSPSPTPAGSIPPFSSRRRPPDQVATRRHGPQPRTHRTHPHEIHDETTTRGCCDRCRHSR
ncbi:hypothetical protein [Verrucomicrobium spinosum]|uniref:hypothetical protein n=1 Tax=Verrucomicrobium spinosum TaxID=2736 RepID=UPI0009465FE3|nr:hypothetical protein [Verrucomicrobium spinosum]